MNGLYLSQEQYEQLCSVMAGSLPLFRAKLRLSQEALAERLDVTRQTVSAFESGQRKMPWSIFLALLMLFTANPLTESLVSVAGLITPELNAFLGKI